MRQRQQPRDPELPHPRRTTEPVWFWRRQPARGHVRKVLEYERKIFTFFRHCWHVKAIAAANAAGEIARPSLRHVKGSRLQVGWVIESGSMKEVINVAVSFQEDTRRWRRIVKARTLRCVTKRFFLCCNLACRMLQSGASFAKALHPKISTHVAP